MLKVKDILKTRGKELITVDVEGPVLQAVMRLVDNNIGAVIVLDAGKPVGILSERDVAGAVIEFGPDLMFQTVRSLMSSDPVTCTPDEGMFDVMARMDRHRIRHLPVMKGEKLLGIISIRDVMGEMLADEMRKHDSLRSRLEEVA